MSLVGGGAEAFRELKRIRWMGTILERVPDESNGSRRLIMLKIGLLTLGSFLFPITEITVLE